MAKKKQEVKEIETTEENACPACGEECKCKKGRARKVIVTILLILSFSVIAFGVGVVTGGFILFGDNDAEAANKDEANGEINENVENDNETDETYEIKLFNEKSPGYVEVKLDSEEDIKSFITVADHFTDESIRKTFFAGNDVTYWKNIFKVAYIIASYGEETSGTYFVEKEFLKEQIGKVFKDGEIEYSGSAYLRANEISFVCGEDVCMISNIMGGGAGDSHYVSEIVGTKKIGENTIYTIQEYYDEWDGGIYTEYDGDLICEKECAEDIFETYGDKLNTYEMTFDKNNRYVSSKKVK